MGGLSTVGNENFEMPKYVSGKMVNFLRGASQEILKRSVSPLCVCNFKDVLHNAS
jgi:hypothetical protein